MSRLELKFSECLECLTFDISMRYCACVGYINDIGGDGLWTTFRVNPSTGPVICTVVPSLPGEVGTGAAGSSPWTTSMDLARAIPPEAADGAGVGLVPLGRENLAAPSAGASEAG
jgi:hypothetical protein